MPVETSYRLTRRALLAGAAAGTSLIALHPFSARAGANQAHLRIMETTDLHVHVFPYDYYADRPTHTVGLARTAAIIETVRAEATNSLLFDNGDFLQGNPMGDYIAHAQGLRAGEVHPVIAAMNTLGYAAGTLGNHDFNYGLDFLAAALAGASFPVVSANVATRQGATPRQDRTLVPPYVVLDRTLTDGAGNAHPIRIGVIGFVPPQILTWDRRHLEGRVQTRDIVACAAALVPQMREQGCDLVLALSHSGIGAAAHVDGMENASVPLARVDGIDVVLTGHTHLVFPAPDFLGMTDVDPGRGTIGGKPAVMAGFWGSHLGLIDLMLSREAGEWRVMSHISAARPIHTRDSEHRPKPLVDSVETVLAAGRQAHEATLDYIRRPVGRTTAPLNSYFSLLVDDPSVQVVSNAQIWYLKTMLQATPHADLPILSAAAPFKAGGRGGPDHYTDVAAGDIAIRNVADLYFYPNTIRAVRVTGAQLRDWLERSASIYHRILPGRADQPLINPEFPSYNFDVIDGVTYVIDPGQPAKFGPKGELVDAQARRIRDLACAGRPVVDDDVFIVATNSYRAGGGGDFPGAGGDTIVFEGPDTNRDIIVRYILEHGTINPAADGNWRLAPMPGTSVLFDTGPGALGHLDELRGLAAQPVGDTDEGFVRLRVHL